MSAAEWHPAACNPGHDCGVARSTWTGVALVFPWPLSRRGFRWSWMGLRNGRRVQRGGECSSIEAGKLKADACALECEAVRS